MTLQQIDPADIERAWALCTDEEREEIRSILKTDPMVWRPSLAQNRVLESRADIIGYGGAAGGGKSDLVTGLALTEHKRSLIVRREKTQTEGFIQRITELLGSTDGYNSQKSNWRYQNRLIEFAGLDNPSDHQKWQGRPHDLKAFDEVTEQRKSQVLFVMGWCRTNEEGQRCRTVMTFNPPTTAEGRWVIDYFGPWLNKRHPNPAKPGDLRYFTTIKGEDTEVPSGDSFVLFKGEPVYDFDPAEFGAEKIITPKSRTFIPSRVTDNTFYMKTGYVDTLQSMPEPLRSQMLNGDFNAGVEDDPWQVIPTSWIEAAMERWEPREAKGPMDSMGCDPAAGGSDKFTIAPRHGTWFDEIISRPGTDFPQEKAGPLGAAHIVANRRDNAVVHIDVIGWGLSCTNHLQSNKVQTVPVNFANGSKAWTEDGKLKFANVRAEVIWRMRETLDPANPNPASLPPDPELAADLAAYKWELRPGGIYIMPKDKMKEDIGRSPDKGDACCLANLTTLKEDVVEEMLEAVASNEDRYSELYSD